MGGGSANGMALIHTNPKRKRGGRALRLHANGFCLSTCFLADASGWCCQ